VTRSWLANGLRAGESGGLIPMGVSYFSNLQNRYGGSGAHPPSYAVGTSLKCKVNHLPAC